MEIVEYRYHVDDLKVEPEAIEACIGYPQGAAPEPVRQLIEKTLTEIREYCDIKGGYVILNDIYFREKNILQINGLELYIEKIISNQIRKSDSVACFLCTSGAPISDCAESLMRQGDLLEGYIMDIVGSEIVEQAMDMIQRDLEERLKQIGLNMTNRYSPGYCGWNVSEQQKLFTLFPDHFCGITLTSHSLMQPVKSVSGIIGIGSRVTRKDYNCRICDITDCLYRTRKTMGNF